MEYEHLEFEAVGVNVDAAYEDASHMIEDYPYRGPAVCAHAMSPYIQDKIVCDLGCGGGDLVWLMARWAKEVVGVEYDSNRLDKAFAPSHVKMKVNVTFKKLDYFVEPVPDADVYYFWPNDVTQLPQVVSRIMSAKGREPFLLVGCARVGFLRLEMVHGSNCEVGWPEGKTGCFLPYVDKHGGKVITFPSREDSALTDPVANGFRGNAPNYWSHNDIWGLCLIPFNGAEV